MVAHRHTVEDTVEGGVDVLAVCDEADDSAEVADYAVRGRRCIFARQQGWEDVGGFLGSRGGGVQFGFDSFECFVFARPSCAEADHDGGQSLLHGRVCGARFIVICVWRERDRGVDQAELGEELSDGVVVLQASVPEGDIIDDGRGKVERRG